MHGGVPVNKEFIDLFEMQNSQCLKKPFIRNIEEGTFIANHNGEILNSTTNFKN